MYAMHTILVVKIWPFSKYESYGVGPLKIATRYAKHAILAWWGDNIISDKMDM
jgi:hypothetical protein